MKKRFKRTAKYRKGVALLAGVMLLTGTFRYTGVSDYGPGVLVVSASKTQQEIDKANQEKVNLENQLGDKQEEISGLKKDQKNLKKALSKLNEEMTAVAENLSQLETQIHETENEIEVTQAELEAILDAGTWAASGKGLQSAVMYENQEKSYLNALIQESNLSDMLNTADYVEKIAAHDRKVMDAYIQSRTLIEAYEDKLHEDMTNLRDLQAKAEAEKSRVEGLIAQTQTEISKYAGSIAEAEREAEAYEEEIRKKEEDLKYLKKKLAEEIALSQAAANATWRDISQVTFAEGDRKLLASIIYCEAGGESYAGKLAVGSVVINRVLSSKYPDTVVGVIYQKSQFSPVASGRLELALTNNKATAACYQAADEAMKGMTNVGQCLYFRRPVEGLVGINIGNHVFY